MQKNTVVAGIEIYKKDIVVIRKDRNRRTQEDGRSWFVLPEGDIVVNEGLRRQAVYEFSKKSRNNLAFVCNNTEVEFSMMVTLTYPAQFCKDGREIKRHLRVFLQWLRRLGIKNYLWFIEFQKRGAPHYHVLIESGEVRIDRHNLSRRWFEIVGSGDSKHLLAGTNIRTPTRKRGLHHYGLKYATKARQKSVPPDYRNVGRLWGCSRGVYPGNPVFVSIDSEASLTAVLQGWDYAGEEKNGYRVLFNASDSVVSLLLDANYFTPDPVG